MPDYRKWGTTELQAEIGKISEEINRRLRGFTVVVDPTMPKDQIEIRSGPHRVLVTNLDTAE